MIAQECDSLPNAFQRRFVSPAIKKHRQIEGKSPRERITQALVVFLAFLLFEFFEGGYDWLFVLATLLLFFVFMIVIDASLDRITQ